MSTRVTSLEMDFKKISEGLTRERSVNPSPWILFFILPAGAFSKLVQALFILSEAKSTTTSIFAPGESRLDLEEILFQRSFNVEGALEDWASDCDASIDRLKHQFLPLIGNTTNLAFMIRFQCTNFSEMEMKDCSIQKKSEDWFEGNEGCDSSSKELKKLPN